MKTTFGLWLVFMAVVLGTAGCSDNKKPYTYGKGTKFRNIIEYCVDNVKYIKFSSGNASWGTVYINPDTLSPENCELNATIEVGTITVEG